MLWTCQCLFIWKDWCYKMVTKKATYVYIDFKFSKTATPKRTFTICIASDRATKQQELDAFSEAVVMAEKAAWFTWVEASQLSTLELCSIIHCWKSMQTKTPKRCFFYPIDMWGIFLRKSRVVILSFLKEQLGSSSNSSWSLYFVGIKHCGRGGGGGIRSSLTPSLCRWL